MKSFLKVLALCAALLALWCCGPDDAPEPDPCAEEPENLAAFISTDRMHGFYRSMQIPEPDTLNAHGVAWFDALHPADSFKVFFGQDSILSVQSRAWIDFEDEFSDYKNGGNIDVTFIAYKGPTQCYPEGRLDTMSKSYFFWTEEEFEIRKSRLSGAYRFQNLEDEADYGYCSIIDSLLPPDFRYEGYYLSGFPKNCEQPLDITIGSDYIRVGTRYHWDCRGDGFAHTSGTFDDFKLVWYKVVDYEEEPYKPIFEEKHYSFRKIN